MSARHNDQHDLVGRLERADAMDHQHIVDIPTHPRLADNFLQRLFGHARIVFERHLGDVRPFVQVAYHADETCNGTDLRIAVTHGRHFRSGIEIPGLYAHRHVSLR